MVQAPPKPSAYHQCDCGVQLERGYLIGDYVNGIQDHAYLTHGFAGFSCVCCGNVYGQDGRRSWGNRPLVDGVLRLNKRWQTQ